MVFVGFSGLTGFIRVYMALGLYVLLVLSSVYRVCRVYRAPGFGV